MKTICGILGTTALRIDGRLTTDWGTPKLRKVLAALATQPNQPMSIDRLTEWVWPEDNVPSDRSGTLHSYASRIRRTLDRVDRGIALDTTGEGYRLNLHPGAVDYYRFRELTHRARASQRAGDKDKATELISEAVLLRRGEPLADLSTERAENWRTRIVDEWISANVDLVSLLLEADRPAEALARLDEVRIEHPLAPPFVELHIETLHRLGRGLDATAAYLRAHGQFREQGDDEAAARLRELHQRLAGAGRSIAHPHAPPTLSAEVLTPWQLPHDVAEFVGRTRVLDALTAAAGSGSGQPVSRVVAVSGAAGVGKTTCVINWGHAQRGRFSDGALFVDLDGYSDREPVTQPAVVDLFLEALGHVPDPATTARARATRLNSLLGDRHVLVVLDNARNSEHVRDLLPVFSRCLVIVTSRQRLTQLIVQHGAREVQVRPMDDDEAISLLTTRQPAARLMTPEALSDLVHLCAGLPLVLNIAAEHVATHPGSSLAEMTRLLSDPQELLDLGGHEDTATVRSILDNSHAALRPAEQRLFRLLAVQPGSDIEVRAASAIDGRPLTATRHSLMTLANTHLLERPDAADRYRIHDLLRAYSLHLLAHSPPDERHAAERRLFSFWLQSTQNALHEVIPHMQTTSPPPPEGPIEPLRFDDEPTAANWVLSERTTLRAVVRHAADRGHYDQSWRIADAIAPIFDLGGYSEDSRDSLEIAVVSARHLGNEQVEAGAWCDLGLAHLNLGEHDAARRCFNRALDLLPEDKLSERGSDLHNLARLDILEERVEAGVAQFQKVLEIAQNTHEDTLLCWTHCRLGDALIMLCRYDEALFHLRQAQLLSEEIRDGAARIQALVALGATHRELGEFRMAEAHCQQALAHVERTQDLTSTIKVYTGLAELDYARKDFITARTHAQRAAEMADHIRSTEAHSRALTIFADCEWKLNNLEAAVQSWEQAAALMDDINQHRGAKRIRDHLAQLRFD